MKKKSIHKEKIEASLAKYLRRRTRDSNHPFIPTRTLFDRIGLDYDNKNDYRMVFDTIHSWRRQAPFFYETMIEEGKINGKDYYKTFEDFLIDWNAVGAFYLWHKIERAKDGTVIHGMYQPDAIQKQQIDAGRNISVADQIETRLLQMETFGQKLPSGLDPEKAIKAIGRFKKTYLLPKGEESE